MMPEFCCHSIRAAWSNELQIFSACFSHDLVQQYTAEVPAALNIQDKFPTFFYSNLTILSFSGNSTSGLFQNAETHSFIPRTMDISQAQKGFIWFVFHKESSMPPAGLCSISPAINGKWFILYPHYEYKQNLKVVLRTCVNHGMYIQYCSFLHITRIGTKLLFSMHNVHG